MPRPFESVTAQRGFTLLELLVVLVLTGMVTAILMQALQHVFRLETHFSKELFSTQQGQMYEDWYRRSVNGLVPDHVDGKNRFKGSGQEFAGLTLAPLSTAGAALLPLAWRLQFDGDSGRTQLRYGADRDAVVVLDWPGNSGRFVYYDAENSAHDTWPPALGKWPQLPRAIFLESLSQQDPRVIVAVPKGPEDPIPRPKDLMD